MVLLAGIVLQSSPVTGFGSEAFRALDSRFAAWMSKNEVPGGVLVVAREGHLILARGFGYADRERRVPFDPTTPFRYGSTAKWMTAMAYMRLVEMGKLKLDEKVADQPALRAIVPAAKLQEAQWQRLTFRMLLSHKSGFRFEGHFTSEWPWGPNGEALSIKQRVAFGLSKGFDNEPGSTFRYANFNFALAGYLFTGLAGESLDRFLQSQVFSRAGLKGISPAGLRESERLPDESQYYVKGDPAYRSIWPEDKGAKVPAPYTCDLRVEAGSGGYRGSALSLLRLMVEFSLDGQKPPLSEKSVKEMVGFDALQIPPATYHGLALNSGSDFRGGYYWGTGGMTPGMSTNVVRRADRTVYVFAFNRNDDIDPNNEELNKIVLSSLDEVGRVPATDLWPKYPSY